MNGQEKLRWGVIGCGRVFPYYAQTLVHHPETQLTAICDRDEGLAIEAMGEYGPVAWFSDYRAMLDRDDVDIVAVCTRGADHEAIVTDALGAGKLVLCETPLRCDPPTGDAARRFGVALPLRYDPAVRAVKKGIEAGAYGEVSIVSIKVGSNCDGLLVGALDLMNWVIGTPKSIQPLPAGADGAVAKAPIDPGGMAPTIQSWVALYDTKPLAFINIADDPGFGCLVNLVGDGAAAWAHEGTLLIVSQDGAAPEFRPPDEKDGPWLMSIYVRMISDFNSCALHGREFWVGSDWVIEAQRLANEAGFAYTNSAGGGTDPEPE